MKLSIINSLLLLGFITLSQIPSLRAAEEWMPDKWTQLERTQSEKAISRTSKASLLKRAVHQSAQDYQVAQEKFKKQSHPHSIGIWKKVSASGHSGNRFLTSHVTKNEPFL